MKALKQTLLGGIAHADAGVGDVDLPLHAIAQRFTANTDIDLPLIGVLDGIADGAALAAAQAIDSDAVYESGVGGNLKLNSSQAKNRVKQYVQTGNIKSQVRELGIKSVVVSGTSVTVTLQAKPNLAFGYLLPISSPVVVSSAKAINKVG